MTDVICHQCKAVNKDTARYCGECGAPLLSSLPKQSSIRSVQPGIATGVILQERYRIVRELGRGGFGAVYRAWDTRLDKAVALKENLETSPEAQRQFAREALVLANLSHSNLPRVTDHFSITGQGQYLVMDFVDGEDLDTLVKKQGAVPVEQALTWIIQVADALEYLHELEPPVFHRDVKPANIRITPKGKAMLVDFGLVKISDPGLKTTLGARAVSPGYAPPEQYGQGKTDGRTDIYGLSATLYKLITGREPPESVQRMAGIPLLPPDQVNIQVTKQLTDTIEHGMALDPAKRFQSAVEFKAALITAKKAGQTAPTAPKKTEDFTVQVGKTAAVKSAYDVYPQPAQPGTIKSEPLPISPAAVGKPGISADRTRVVDIEPDRYPSTTAAVSIPDASRFQAGRAASQPSVKVGANIPLAPAAPVSKPLSKSLPQGLIFAGIGFAILACLGLGGLIYAFIGVPDNTDITATADRQSTIAARVQGTSTALAQSSVVIIASSPTKPNSISSKPTETRIANSPAATNTSKPKPTTAKTMTPVVDSGKVTSLLKSVGIMDTPKLVVGPESGSLNHTVDNYIEELDPEVDVKDFVAQATIKNPYSPTRGDWDYGFMFNHDGKNAYYLILNQKREWELTDINWKKIAGGTARYMDTSDGGTNEVTLVVKDNHAWLFINGQQIVDLNLANQRSGSVILATGFRQGTEMKGEKTDYKDFTVWEFP